MYGKKKMADGGKAEKKGMKPGFMEKPMKKMADGGMVGCGCGGKRVQMDAGK